MQLSRRSTNIFFDTAPIIYFVEADTVWGPLVKQIVDSAIANRDRFISSVITLSEVLVKPSAEADEILQAKFKQFLRHGKNLTLLEITAEIAELAANLRGLYPSLKGMDSIQLAAAITSDADIFLTNDRKLKKISEIRVMLLEEYRQEQSL